MFTPQNKRPLNRANNKIITNLDYVFGPLILACKYVCTYVTYVTVLYCTVYNMYICMYLHQRSNGAYFDLPRAEM